MRVRGAPAQVVKKASDSPTTKLRVQRRDFLTVGREEAAVGLDDLLQPELERHREQRNRAHRRPDSTIGKHEDGMIVPVQRVVGVGGVALAVFVVIWRQQRSRVRRAQLPRCVALHSHTPLNPSLKIFSTYRCNTGP